MSDEITSRLKKYASNMISYIESRDFDEAHFDWWQFEYFRIASSIIEVKRSKSLTLGFLLQAIKNNYFDLCVVNRAYDFMMIVIYAELSVNRLIKIHNLEKIGDSFIYWN